MAKIKHDPDHIKIKQQYADLLKEINKKPSEEEIAAIRKRIEERRVSLSVDLGEY